MPITLEEFIADCVATIAQRRAEEDAERAEQERQFQELLQSVKASLRSRIIATIPQPLRQFTDYAGIRPTLEELQGYPNTWTPSSFKVEAPGLQLINFSTATDGATAPLRITDIRIQSVSFGTDWIEAVAAAVITP